MMNERENPTVAVTATLVRFFGALDERLYDEAARLMASSGTWLRQGVLLTGPDQVRAALEERPLDMTTVHGVSSVLVESSQSGANATFIGTVHSHRGPATGEPLKPSAMQVSRYTCELVQEKAEWRVQQLRSKIVFRN